MKKNNQKSFWPYGITIAIIAVIIMAAGTLVIAINHPVQMDEAYMKKYQNVDTHINEIKKSQRLFDEKYTILISKKYFKIGKNDLCVDIINKNTKQTNKKLKVYIKLTRPDNDKYDIKIDPVSISDRGYMFSDIDIKKAGRWIILLSVTDGKVDGFFKKEIDTKN